MTPKALANRIEAERKTLTSQLADQLLSGPRHGWTKGIKKLMGDLGKSLGFEVAASGYEDADQGEFLYDLVWYKLDDFGFVLYQPAVVEIGCAIASMAVDNDDFQKLIQARTDVCPQTEFGVQS
jgi:hypothetical protein